MHPRRTGQNNPVVLLVCLFGGACTSGTTAKTAGAGGASGMGGTGGMGAAGSNPAGGAGAGGSGGGGNVGTASSRGGTGGGTVGGIGGAPSRGGAGGGAGSGIGGAPSRGGAGGGAGSGAGGARAGSGGAGAGGAAGAQAGSQSVLQRGHDLMRHASFTEPALTRTAAQTMAPNTAFNANAKFSGGMQSSVLYLQPGPAADGCTTGAVGCLANARAAGAGLFFAASQSGGVYAFDEKTGLTVWHTPLPGGGDGVRGTPAIDGASRTLFVTVGVSGHHEVHALAVDDGTERAGWPVTLSSANLSAGGIAFNSTDQNQHGALLLLNGILYVPFGGHYGDGGSYRGWVVAIAIADPTKRAAWVTAGSSEGIWGHGGLASDGTSVFAVTGNGHAGSHDTSTDAEEVVRLTGMAVLNRTAANVFYPAAWHQMDSTDKDFGASTPAYVPLPAGSTPAAILIAPAKPGHVYILDGTNLSSGEYPAAGGQLADLTVADTGAESVYTAPTVYTSASGLHAAIDVSKGPANCPNQVQGDHAIIALSIQPGQTPIAREAWCAAVSGNTGGTQQNGPPISTTSDGNAADALVWFMNGSQLSAVDGDTGAQVVTTTGGACATPNMSFPIAVNGRLVVASSGGLCSWSPGGNL